MITLWGRKNSINVRKVLWALEEMGAPYTRVEAGREHGVVDAPAYRAMNPNGLIPTIRDGDLTLWESNAILRYLAAAYGGAAFWAADPVERARVDMWMDWQQTELTPACAPGFIQLVRVAPSERDAKAVERSRLDSEAKLATLDAALEGRDWLGGPCFGLAELCLGPMVFRTLETPWALAPWPNVERWRDAFMARPAAQRVLTLPLT
jgi:glutathione S-transferase